MPEISVAPILPSRTPSPSLRLYRRIAGLFVFFVTVVLVIVLFVSTAKATIHIIPQPQTVEASFLVDVVQTGVIEGRVKGSEIEKTFEQAKEFPVSNGEKKEVLDKAQGQITIINETSKIQPLVATTRFLSSKGILFRLDKSVTVPANGKIDVSVHADQLGPTGDIEPDRFTIPGLSTSLQPVIYGVSSVSMSGGQRFVSVVTQEELDQAATALEKEMLEAAKGEFRGQKGDAGGEVFQSEMIKKVSNTMPGDEAETFTISLSLRVTAVFYDTEGIEQLAERKLYEQLSQGFTFLSVPVDQMHVTVTNILKETNEAQIRVELTGVSILSPTHPLLDKSSMVGRSPKELKDRLTSAGLASDVVVEIFPPWMKKIPALKDHVDVVVDPPILEKK
jgi:hypothetical protein